MQSLDFGLNAMGHSSCRAVLETLRVRRRSVRELAQALPLSRPAISQHLAILKRANLVRVRPEGTRRY